MFAKPISTFGATGILLCSHVKHSSQHAVYHEKRRGLSVLTFRSPSFKALAQNRRDAQYIIILTRVSSAHCVCPELEYEVVLHSLNGYAA